MRVATLVAVLLSARPAEAADDQFTYSLDTHSKRWPSQPAYGAVSWDQAKCMLRNRKIAFVGDSNTRFHFFTFNVFLDSGLLRSGPYRKDGEAPPDYDHATRKRTWTDWKARSPRSDHRSHFTKSFDSLGTTSDFYFAQTTWFGDDVTRSKNMADLAKDLKGYDLVVFNSGWWDLKPWNETKRGYVACGDDWTAACATSYFIAERGIFLRRIAAPPRREWSEAGPVPLGWSEGRAAATPRRSARGRVAAPRSRDVNSLRPRRRRGCLVDSPRNGRRRAFRAGRVAAPLDVDRPSA